MCFLKPQWLYAIQWHHYLTQVCWAQDAAGLRQIWQRQVLQLCIRQRPLLRLSPIILHQNIHISFIKTFTYPSSKHSHILHQNIHISFTKTFTYPSSKHSHILHQNIHISFIKTFTRLYVHSLHHISCNDYHNTLARLQPLMPAAETNKTVNHYSVI